LPQETNPLAPATIIVLKILTLSFVAIRAFLDKIVMKQIASDTVLAAGEILKLRLGSSYNIYKINAVII
jgi:hypothetical protein